MVCHQTCCYEGMLIGDGYAIKLDGDELKGDGEVSKSDEKVPQSRYLVMV